MKTKWILLATTLLFLRNDSAVGAEPGMRYDHPPDPAQKFRANELSLDIFGTGSVNEEVVEHPSGDRVTDDGRLGVGLGANYFFMRHWGLSGEGYTENAGHSFVDNASGSLVFRWPFESLGLAPYLFAGGGWQFDPIEQWFGHGGGGLEFRFRPQWGIFADARYVVTEDSENFGLGRLGLRLVF
jgi:hypothetical protein